MSGYRPNRDFDAVSLLIIAVMFLGALGCLAFIAWG